MSDLPNLIPKFQNGKIDCNQGAVRAVRYNVDGNYCLTCGSDKSLKLWNPQKKSLLKTYSGHGYEVLDARGSCDNSQLVSCGMDKTVILWDVGSGSAIRKWRGHAGTVNCVKFNEDSSVAISGSIDGSVKCWDTRSKRNEPIQSLEETKDSVTSIDVSDYEILVGCVDKRVRRYDLRNGNLTTDFIGSSISQVGFTMDGQCYLASSTNDTLKLMDKSTGELLQEFTGHVNKQNYRLEAALNNTDQLILSGSENGFVYIWELINGSIIAKLDHTESTSTIISSITTIHSLSYHPNHSALLTASKNLVFLWSNREITDDEDQQEI